MNELLSVAEAAAKAFQADVLQLLKNELRDAGQVAVLGKHILIHISKNTFEQKLGNLLQQIHQVIDQRFPERNEHLSIIIRDTEPLHEQVFKIWKTA